MNNSCKATSSQRTALGSVPWPLMESRPLMDSQPLTAAEFAADSGMFSRLILIVQFRSCHRRNYVFQTRKSFTLCGDEVTSYNHLLGKPSEELFARCSLVPDSRNHEWNCQNLLHLGQLRSISVFNETPCCITLFCSLAVLKMQDVFIFMLS